MQTIHRVEVTNGPEKVTNASGCYPEIFLFDDRLEISTYATIKSDWETDLLHSCDSINYLYENNNTLNAPIVKRENNDSDGLRCTVSTAGSNNKYRIGVLIKLFSEWRRAFKENDNYISTNIPKRATYIPGISFSLDNTATWNGKPALQINFVIHNAAFIKYLTSTSTHINQITAFNMHNKLQTVVIKAINTPPKINAPHPTRKSTAVPPGVANALKTAQTFNAKRNHNNVAEEIVGDEDIHLDTKIKVSMHLKDITLTQRNYDLIVNILQSEGISLEQQTKTVLINN